MTDSSNTIKVVRTGDQEKYGLVNRHVFGLNLFSANDVRCRIGQRPDVLFLKYLTERVPCSAQIGALYLKDCTEAPEEMFGLPDGPDAETPYHMARRVGFCDGFYDLRGGVPFEMWLADGEWMSGETLHGDCFFPRVTPAFWETLQRGEGDLDQLFSCHGLALYAGPKTKEAGVNMVALLDAPFSDEGQFLRTATDLYAVLVLTGHDGEFFHAFAKSADDFALLEPALSDAVRAVEGSDWFRTNKARLAWSEELDACLMLPISRAVEANT